MRDWVRGRTPGEALRDDAGETMVETLAAILVSALSLLMLAGAIGASVNMIMRSRESMTALYRDEGDMILAAEAEDEGTALDVTLGVALSRDDQGRLRTIETVGDHPSGRQSGIAVYGGEEP